MKTKSKKYFLMLVFLLANLFLLSSKASAAYPCRDNGGECYAVTDCSQYTSGGKVLTSISAGDAACGAVYEKPVKCCKTGTELSSKPAARVDGTDASASSGATGFTGEGTRFTNPLRFETVDQFLTTIMSALQKVIVTLALVMIVLGAVLYVTSGGGKQMETAKGMITAALVGLAIGLAAPSFLKEIANVIGWGGTTPAALSLTQIALNVLNFLLGILGILALVMLVIGATMYLTSAGDQTRIDTGKKIFTSSLIGVVIAMASMVLVYQVAKFFITTPASSPQTVAPAPVR